MASSSDVDERWSSFYHWVCLSPRENGCKMKGCLWRREHEEGPTNESGGKLSIRKDEMDGRPLILECRREWRGGRSENHRTYYIEPLPRPHEAKTWAYDNPSVLNGTHQPYAHRPGKRLSRNYHAEYDQNQNPTERRDFILARTKHQGYHLPSSTFIDLVNDPVPRVKAMRSQDRLRLRTVSRIRRNPIGEQGADGSPEMLFRPTQGEDGQPVEGSEDRFISSDVYMWPRDAAPSEIYQILCPESRLSSMHAVSDERSIIYSVSSAGLPRDHQALILISFDPTIHLSGLQSLQKTKRLMVPGDIFPVEVPRPQSPDTSIVQVAVSLYKAINCNYWLR